MRRFPWRSLLVALTVGFVGYWSSAWLWQCNVPKATYSLPWLGNCKFCNSLEFSPDGSLIVVGVGEMVGDGLGGSAAISLWVVRTEDGKVVASTNRDLSHDTSCVFSPKGDLFGLYHHRIVEIREASTGRRVRSYEAEYVDAIFFDVEGRLWATACGIELVVMSEAALEAYRIERNPAEYMLVGGNIWALDPLTFAFTFCNIEFCLRQKGQVKSWNLWDYQVRDGTHFGSFFAGVRKGQPELWDIIAGESLGQIPEVARSQQLGVAPNGRSIVYDQQSRVVVYDIKAKCSRPIYLTPGWQTLPTCCGIYRPAFSPNCENLAIPVTEWVPEPLFYSWLAHVGIQVGGGGQSHFGVKFCDIASGAELAFFPDATRAAFSHDGKTLALGYGDGKIALLDLPVQSGTVSYLTFAMASAIITFAAALWIARRRVRKIADTSASLCRE